MTLDILESFHPAVARWFAGELGPPTEPQVRGWPAIQARRNTLIAAPTGSGKTLAAFLAAIDALVRQGVARDGVLPDETQVVYVSPLKALSNDIQRNLEEPLLGIGRELEALGLPAAGIRTSVRTGDTPAAARQAMVARPPHLFVTTPESLYILLTSERGRRMLATAHTVIVDEIHALVRDKRGSHLALSLERLAALTSAHRGGDQGLVRIGLSATQRPIDEIARFLVGAEHIAANGEPECAIIDAGHRRTLDLALELPRSPLEAVMSAEVWTEVYDRLADLIREHRTTLVFVNTRRLAERLSRHLSERLGEEHVTSHHGSLAREQRFLAEQRLKAGELKALVATASLELGIDIGAVDLVCQIGSTRSIATLLQRVGRSGHHLAGVPKGRLFPTSRDELVECAALLDSVGRGELDRIMIPEAPLDILAQQIVAAVAAEEWSEDGLFDLVRRAHPFRRLARERFDQVVGMLADGFTTRRGRRGAYLHRDQVNGRLRARRGARLAAITSGGAIPDTADYEVVLDPAGTLVGTVNEDFAIESMAGDIFQLGNASWRIMRIEPGRVRVEDARGEPPTIPFWFGEAPGRTAELSSSVSRFRSAVAERLLQGGPAAARAWLEAEIGIARPAAEQIADYLGAARAALGVMPTQETIVVERFFDESGGMQLVVHAPFGSRLNRAWGLSLRKRFCQRFNFELQAAATEDAIVLSLGPTHSFPLDAIFGFLSSATVRDVLVQALLAAPMFATRWRWNTTRALAVLRFRGGRKVPPRFQRMDADDLLSLVFPDQVACFENLPPGPLPVPEHPLVLETIRDCLVEAMDIEALESLLTSIESGERELVARDLTEPSPLAQEILSARPYAFLDDAPLEERRTQAVLSRRWLDPETASDLGALDASAIERVRAEAWPQVETADELHDAMCLLGGLTAAEMEAEPRWRELLAGLVTARRATRLEVPTGPSLWVAAERLPELGALHPEARLDPPITAPAAPAARVWTPDEALVEIVRGRLESSGPVVATALARALAVAPGAIAAALAALESEGFALRGRFTPGTAETEWCERRLLARIHRYTLHRLRSEIEPVSSADFMRFLCSWQRVTPSRRMAGPEALALILEQLAGFEAPAASWESEILTARLGEYDPLWLDGLCLSGRVAWLRLTPPRANGKRRGRVAPVRSTPIAIIPREHLGAWREAMPPVSLDASPLSPDGRRVLDFLIHDGASFFPEIGRGTGLLRTQVEAALAELVAHGLATADSFTGLRALLTPSAARPPLGGRRRRRRGAVFGMETAGRWTRVTPGEGLTGDHTVRDGPAAETIARALLLRYGVVFRRLAVREGTLPPWRDLLRVYRRLEARGEIRGGRFVAGFAGEQYALPEAVSYVRATRRETGSGELIAVSAADPLNLLGIITPGERLPALTGNRILFRDGVPIAVREARAVRFLVDLTTTEQTEAERVLLRRRVALQWRAYMGR